MFLAPSTPPQSSRPIPARATASVLRPLLDSIGLGWFCLRGEGRREHMAALALDRRSGVEAFAPRIRVRKECRAGGVVTTTEALFPGYLFARFRYPEQVRRVVSTTGVVGLVSFGGPPPRLADDTIAHLRQHAEPIAPPLSPVFEEGDWVRVAAGCFRGAEGRVRELTDGRGRICVLLSLLGHDVEVSLPAGQLAGRPDPLGHVPVALRAV